MSTPLDRLRIALAPDYQVERELARGGMGIVYLARDVALDRLVAVKVLRQELATARSAKRFLREARILANLTHPNVVAVHKAGEAGEFFYYVMDYLECETLAARLARGPLGRAEALKLGRDLLDALEAVHRLGVIHRDIKPSNIFLYEGRAVLSDFGIARPSLDRSALSSSTAAGGLVGTIGYMAPEQAYGEEVSPQTDLYAVGMVLYEVYVGRQWQAVMLDARPDWSNVPRAVAPILRRALAPEPRRRWPDASSFRRKLWRTRTRRYRARTLLLTLGGLFAGGSLALWLRPDRPPQTGLAVLPIVADSTVDPDTAENLRLLVKYNVETFVDAMGGLTPDPTVSAWWAEYGTSLDAVGQRARRALGAAYVAQLSLTAADGAIDVSTLVVGRTGERQLLGRVRLDAGAGLYTTGHLLGYQIARTIDPARESQYSGSPALAERSNAALDAFLEGERAFGRNAFRAAIAAFERALTIDSSFVLAAWGLSNAYRWFTSGAPHPTLDLSALYAARQEELHERDRRLIQAQLEPDAARRFELYRDAIRRSPRDYFTHFLYADELFHRGAYTGIPLEVCVRQLEAALVKDSTFSPTLEHLVWAYVKVGRQDSAERALEHLTEVSGGPGETLYYQPPLLRFVLDQRFAPETAAASRARVLDDPEVATSLWELFRIAPMFGLHDTQRALAEHRLADSTVTRRERGNLYEAKGLALVAAGRVVEALSMFDSAAALLDTPQAALEANEWRVVGAALGLPGVPEAEVAAGRRALRRESDARSHWWRAAWALSLDAAARGDTPTAAQWRDRLRTSEQDTTRERLHALADAFVLAGGRRYEQALQASEPLLAYDSAGRGGDVFARAALHLGRAAWLDSLGRHAAADSMRLWYEHSEFIGLPEAEAQAAEIDWALGPYTRWLRGMNAGARGSRDSACGVLRQPLDVWAEPDTAYTVLVQRARNACRSSS